MGSSSSSSTLEDAIFITTLAAAAAVAAKATLILGDEAETSRPKRKRTALNRDREASLMPGHAKMLSVQVPSPTNNGGGGHNNGSPYPYVAANANMDGGFSQAEILVSSSKKLENELLLLGQNIKDHEENIESIKTRISSLDDQITDIQVTLGKNHPSNTHTTEDENLSKPLNDKAVLEHIMKHENTAASMVCQLKYHSTHDDHPTWIKDVIGVVATLGKVYDDNLSRLLSEYLGLDTMLALVCMSYDGVKGLETYFMINRSSGLDGLGSAMGRTMEGRFNVICLENLKPFAGDFMAGDPQRRLALLKPKLPNGNSPAGFMGFAVNMIHITTNGYGLRETLFYSLFSRLQVYKTRAHMLQALPCISHGAISLDGGIIRSNGVFVFGNRKEMDVRFAVSGYLPENLVEKEKQMKDLKWEKKTMLETLQVEHTMVGHIRYNFEVKKQEFVRFMAQSSPYAMQYPVPATPRRSTPR